METNSPSSCSSLKSRFRVHTISPTISSQTHLLIFLLSINLTAAAASELADFDPLYTKHCNDVVPKSDTDPSKWFLTTLSFQDIAFHTSHFTGGHRLFNHTLTASNYRNDLTFRPNHVSRTLTHGVFHVRAAMDLHSIESPTRRNLRMVTFRQPRVPFRRGLFNFRLEGYYSESAKKLCMIGTTVKLYNAGNSEHSLVVLKLNYPRKSVIYDSLITGTIVNVAVNDDSFEPIMVLGFSVKAKYEYTFVGKDRLSGFPSSIGEGLGLNNMNDPNKGLCRLLGNRLERYDLEYGSGCDSVNCNPVAGNGTLAPTSMVVYGARCTDGRQMQMLLGFVESSGDEYIRFPFVPSRTFIAEGEWDEKENHLRAVACRILNFTESLNNAVVGDCTTKLILRFPARLTLRNRSAVAGQIWSNGGVNDSGYFGKIGFKGLSGWLVKLLDYKYDYSVNDTVRETCVKKRTRDGKGKKYPEEYSSDMKFDMRVKNSKGQVAWGYSSPLFVEDDRVYGRRFWVKPNKVGPRTQMQKRHRSPMNISYKLSFRQGTHFFPGLFPYKAELAAEGIYDRDYGNLCMTGCRHVPSNDQKVSEKDMLDCAIKIDVHFPPLNAKNGQNIEGTIESTRGVLDPLYFERVEFSSNSIYHNQAAESITRIDLEIVMVLISNTLACAFVCLQLYFVKKHPDVLPFISMVMLIVFTLGHIIPILFNFEAMFAPSHSQQNTFLWTGGWLAVNEVIVRVIMMVTFVLLLWLLQLTWFSRQSDGNQKSLRDAEMKVLYVALPLYIAGALITWFVHQRMNTHQGSFRTFHRNLRQVANLWHLVHPQHSVWDDLKSYAGFILDCFLLPQILFNLFFSSGQKALSFGFYFGTTMVRLLPHTYDLYRAHTYRWILAFSYVYANPKTDFYNTAWNIIIPCGGLLFASIIFLQQRFGGRCILPNRFRHSSVYEKVPVISNEEL